MINNQECFKNNEIEHEICWACNGSGEGAYDGSICRVCHGWGELIYEGDNEK